MEYQIRCWNNKGKRHWELWRVTGRWPLKREEMLSKHATERAAEAAMAKTVDAHYCNVESYDERGRRIFYF